jgi:hypothetical protein
LLEVLSQLFLSHDAKLLSVINGVFDLLDFLEDLFLVGLEGELFSRKRVADTSYLSQHVSSRLQNDDEGSSRLYSQRGADVFGDVVGYVKGVKNAMALGCTEDHFPELQDIFRRDDSGNVDQSELRQGGFGEIYFLHF